MPKAKELRLDEKEPLSPTEDRLRHSSAAGISYTASNNHVEYLGDQGSNGPVDSLLTHESGLSDGLLSDGPQKRLDDNGDDSDLYSPAITYPTAPADIEGGNTSMKLTVLLLVNNVIGGGILSLPTCFHQTSIVVGVILLLFTTAVTMLNIVFIVDASSVADEYRYGVLISENFHPAFANLMFISLIIWPLGTCVAYAQIVSEAMPPVMKSFGVADDNFLATPACWLIISGGIFFAISCRRHLKDLLLPSVVGLIAIGVSGVAVLYRCFDGTYQEGGQFAPVNYTAPADGVEPVYFSTTMFMALPVFAFALNVHSNAPHYYMSLRLKNGKRSPRKMFKAIGYSHIIITALYIIFGVFGVLTFDNDDTRIADLHGDILNGYSDKDSLMNVIRIFYFIVILVSFPILHMAARKGFNQFVFPERELPFWALAVETFCIIVFSCIVAAFIPSLNQTLAVLGSLVGVVVMFVGPSILYLKLVCTDEYIANTSEATSHYHPVKKIFAYISIFFGIVVPGILGLLTTFVKI